MKLVSQSLFIAFFFFLSIKSNALIGGQNSTELIPHQLCQIVPISKGRPISELSCSALAIGNQTLQTAGHCGYDFYHNRVSTLYIDCYSGDSFPIETTEQTWKFFDPQGPLNPRLKVSQENSDRVRYDVAEIYLPTPLSLAPTNYVSTQDAKEKIDSSKKCFLATTGTDELMRWGIPQAKRVRKSQISIGKNGVILIKGEPYASGHDSGGALICDDTLIATIAAQAGKNTILTSNWLPAENEIGDLPLCSGNFSSKAVAESVQHLLGFTEIRDFINLQTSQELHVCLQGLTLGKNAYQYYQNLLFIKFFDDSSKLVKMSTLLFQVSSIQGHHSTEGRPWVALDSSKMLDTFQKLLPTEAHWKPKPVGLPLTFDLLNFEDEIEASSLFLYSEAEFDFYLVSWLKTVTSVNAGLYTSQVSPKYALYKKNIQTGEVLLVKKSGAFNSILLPAEALLKEASQQVSSMKMNDEEKAKYLERLSRVR